MLTSLYVLDHEPILSFPALCPFHQFGWFLVLKRLWLISAFLFEFQSDLLFLNYWLLLLWILCYGISISALNRRSQKSSSNFVLWDLYMAPWWLLISMPVVFCFSFTVQKIVSKTNIYLFIYYFNTLFQEISNCVLAMPSDLVALINFPLILSFKIYSFSFKDISLVFKLTWFVLHVEYCGTNFF